MKNTKNLSQQLKQVRYPFAIIFMAIIALSIIRMSWRRTDLPPSDNSMPAFAVKQGALTINVIESGTIKAKDQIVMKCEVEGKTTIIFLVSEGEHVKKGELLVELDASSLLDRQVDQQIIVQNAEASFINSRENLEVVKNQTQSERDRAQLTLDFSRLDIKKYEEGEYPNQLKEAETKIIIAKEELTRAREQLEWSKKLFTDNYISHTELQADELAEKQKNLDLELAQSSLDLLKNYTHMREMTQLASDVKQAEMALERTLRKANADIIQAEAELKARESEYNRQKDKLDKIKEQIIKTKLRASSNGLVIYATSAQSGGWRNNTEPLAEGQEVHERQELLYLSNAAGVKAEIDIHETNLDKVDIGLSANITVDALPGQRYAGKVTRIAPLPDARSMWFNPDLKVYATEVDIEGMHANLRSGMSCKVEIVIEHYQDATYVPVQAVIRRQGEPTVFMITASGIEPRVVEVGKDNGTMICVMKGLKSGELISLSPPFSSNSDMNKSSEPKEKSRGSNQGQKGDLKDGVKSK